MPRTPNTPQTVIDTSNPGTDIVAAQNLSAERSALVLKQYGDGMPYDLARYEHLVRLHFQRSAEEMLAAGRALLVIREHVQHGEWRDVLTRIGMEPRVAQRMMQAAARFSNASTSTHLIEAAGHKSKLLELVVLDDDQLVELNEGATVSGLNLDEISRMSTSELRKKVREITAEHDATEKLLGEKNEAIDKLQRDLKAAKRRIQEQPINEVVVGIRQEFVAEISALEGTIRNTLREGISQLMEATEQGDAQYAADALAMIDRAVADVRAEFGLPEIAAKGSTPGWMDTE